MSSFTALDGVYDALQAATGNETRSRMVATRVLMRTSVNLLKPRPDQMRDPAAIKQVIGALGEMGYQL